MEDIMNEPFITPDDEPQFEEDVWEEALDQQNYYG